MAENIPSEPSEAVKWKPKKKKFLEICCRQCYNTQPLRRWQRAKITKIWENPFIFRSFELMISTIIAGIFMESSLPLEGYENLALHTGICGPIIPIFALFSSSVMLDRNPRSALATQALLAISAGLYFLTVVILTINWPVFGMNRTKFKLALVSMSGLASVAFILLLVDLLAAWIVPCCKMSKCCLKPFARKKKQEEAPQPAEDQPPAQ